MIYFKKDNKIQSGLLVAVNEKGFYKIKIGDDVYFYVKSKFTSKNKNDKKFVLNN